MGIDVFFPGIRDAVQAVAAIHTARVLRFTGTAPTSAALWGGEDRGAYPTGYTVQYAALPCYVFVPVPPARKQRNQGQVADTAEYFTQGFYEMRVFVTTINGLPLDLTTNDIVDSITSKATGLRLFEQSSPYQIIDIAQMDAQTVVVLKAIAGKGTS